jgi:hypothetical protein
LSDRELQDRREALESGMLGFRAELAGTLFRAVSELHPVPLNPFFDSQVEEELAEELSRNSTRPGESLLVSGVARGMRSEGGEIRFEQYDPAKRKFVAAAWPEGAEAFRAALQPQKSEAQPRGDLRPASTFLLNGEHPLIALPLMYRTPGFQTSEGRTIGPPPWDWTGRPPHLLPGRFGPRGQREEGPPRFPMGGPPPAPPGDSQPAGPRAVPSPGSQRESPRLVGWRFLILY